MRIRFHSGWKFAWTCAAAATTTSRSTTSLSSGLGNHLQSGCLVHSFSIRSNTHRQRTKKLRNYSRKNMSSSTQQQQQQQQPETSLQFVDIGANLLDERYTDGIYFGKKRHDADFDLVLERSLERGVSHLILTAGTLRESHRALELVEAYKAKEDAPPIVLGCTVGVHPTRCQQEFVDEDKNATVVMDELQGLLEMGSNSGSVVAIGEFGLDYDRLEFSPKDVQIEFFQKQLDRFLSLGLDLPLFLHNRSVGKDLLEILKGKATKDTLRGVVHSFDDSLELAQEFIEMGLYIGLNGCSLKTEENLAVVKELPLDKILLETDCPYCEIKATHAGHHHIQTTFAKKPDKKFEMGKMVKGRNEPCQIIQVAEVIAGVKGLSLEEVASACYQNSMDLYKGFVTAPKVAIN